VRSIGKWQIDEPYSLMGMGVAQNFVVTGFPVRTVIFRFHHGTTNRNGVDEY